jgi:hypothetical protein
VPAADALLRGCDVLDPAHCLLPFPSDHFTVAAPPESPQSVARGGTGRRIHLSPLATPRNAIGKPIDPTEWNRNDGFSPGQMIVTYVPNLGTVNGEDGKPRGPIVGGSPITDVSRSLDVAGSSVVVLDAATAEPHLVWAEVDLNAGLLLPSEGIAAPTPARPALIVRPAINFAEGHRYVVVLKGLVDSEGAPIAAQAAFRACRDRTPTSLPPIAERCAALETDVFPVLEAAGVARDESLYLAWDFTVASAENTIGRLRSMRDDAFRNVLGQTETADGAIVDLGRPPPFKVTEVIERPNAELARVVKGTFVVPSYVVPPDPSPLDGHPELTGALADLGRNLPDELGLGIVDGEDLGTILASGSLPPNRLFYDPTDGPNPEDPGSLLWGDGLPDRTGEMTVTFTCNIPRSVVSGKPFPTAVAADVRPARPSLYGHGLLGGQGEVGAGNVRAMGNEHGVMFCAADWFGFATGDLPNIVTAIADMSNFAVVPDASQQGMLNQIFLARLLRHPRGFARHGAFQVEGRPVFDPGEVFYDGNSQGGILGGVVVAASKDIGRAVLGVPGMNYSTLLQRSVDFDVYSIPVYLNYQDDLDRNLIFAMIQMLWDRSENDGWAHHLANNSALGGPDKRVLLHPAFADHQVSMWTAEVLARTIGARVDRSRVTPERHPDDNEYFGLDAFDSANAAHRAGSALVVWDNHEQPPPPIGNVPPREGEDPHEFPRAQRVARCQKSHFLRSDGEVIAVPARDDGAESFVCP